MSELTLLEVHDDVAVITLNNPPVNALSSLVVEAVIARANEVATDDSVQSIVLIGAGSTFSAGADISEFEKFRTADGQEGNMLHNAINLVEALPKPVVAAIHGTALGGGLELALGCHYRLADASAKIGLPEVKLGLIPGAMGTQRLPRLCGITKAAEICATGEMVGAPEAAEAGIIDAIYDTDLLKAALAAARRLAATGQPLRRTSEINDQFGDRKQNAAALDALKQVITKKARGQLAPLRATEAVEMSATVSFAEGVHREREIFAECLKSDQSKGLIHIFFGERAVGKVPGISKETPRRPVKRAAVVGAGTMGGGITMCYLNTGIPVVLKEVDHAQLEAGLERIRHNYGVSVERGKMTEQDVEQRMSLITPTTDYSLLGDADIIVEAVFENMELKKRVFSELDEVARPGAILASNTSTLDIDQIASATNRPESVIGHHFFSPANVMKLLEIVRGRASGEDVIATSMDLARRLRKVGVFVGNCFGFVGNRMFWPYLREAQFVLEEGVRVEQVDQAHFEFGMAMGPHAVGDLAGLDVTWRINQEMCDTIPKGMRLPLVADKLYEMGRYGQKTTAGWYRYEGRSAISDPIVEDLIQKTAEGAGIVRREISDDEILERTMYAMVNEGALILQEGIALRSVDIDIVFVHGYGFPAWRGGPMQYADTVGLKKVHDRICEFEEEHGFWWKPAPLLTELAETGGRFRDWTAAR